MSITIRVGGFAQTLCLVALCALGSACGGGDDGGDGGGGDTSSGSCGDNGGSPFGGPSEMCNGQDDDCDGMIDEGVLNACGGCGTLEGEPEESCGLCSSGTYACDGTDAVACEGEGSEDELLNLCGTCGDIPSGGCDM